jgi:hypothetical protein
LRWVAFTSWDPNAANQFHVHPCALKDEEGLRSLMSALGYAQWLAGLQHGAPFLSFAT